LGKSGYCYGWVNSRVTCVAGVLQVGSLEHAKAFLDDFLSENPRFTEVSSTDDPVILGECSSSSSSFTPSIQFLRGVGPPSSITGPSYTIVTYRRNALGSARFHAPENIVSSRNAAIPDNHPTFDIVGLDATALAQLNATYRLHSLLNLPGSWLANFKLLDKAARSIHDTCTARPERAWPYMSSGPKFFLRPIEGILRQCLPFVALGRIYSKLLDQLWARSNLIQSQVSYPRLSYVYGKLETSAEHVRFNNAIWLVLNDVILGSIAGAFVRDNSEVIGTSLHDWLKTIFIDFTRDALLWLDDWPEGLKLNTELSSFLLHVFLGVLELWACECIQHFRSLRIKFCAAARHFTFAVSSFSHDCLRDWPFGVRRSDRPVVAILGPVQRPHLTCLIELPPIEKGTIVPDVCLALIMELIQRKTV